jgi:hypothetical protein
VLVEFPEMLIVMLVSPLPKPIVELVVYFGKLTGMLVLQPRKHFGMPAVFADYSHYCYLEVVDLAVEVPIEALEPV